MADKVQCGCMDCECMVDPAEAIEVDGDYYCSDECAEGHPEGAGCGHAGCGCGG